MEEDNVSLFWSLIILGLVIWGGIRLFRWIFIPKHENVTQESNFSNKDSFIEKEECIEPENPYSYGTGHYAGFEWGEQGNSCGGNSTSFIEGCEDHEEQEEIYESCLAK
jgi:hypothetical protein